MSTEEDNKKVGLKKSMSASERRRKLRDQLWPDISEEDLWLRKQRQGFTTIPRTMSLIGRIMDLHSEKGFPLQQTYLTLWCWVYDEGMVIVKNPKEFAFESGFSGPRGEATWRVRMKKLRDLGFIQSKSGLFSDFQFVLLLNPIKVIDKIYQSKTKDVAYNALLNRLSEVGANDLDL